MKNLGCEHIVHHNVQLKASDHPFAHVFDKTPAKQSARLCRDPKLVAATLAGMRFLPTPLAEALRPLCFGKCKLESFETGSLQGASARGEEDEQNKKLRGGHVGLEQRPGPLQGLRVGVGAPEGAEGAHVCGKGDAVPALGVLKHQKHQVHVSDNLKHWNLLLLRVEHRYFRQQALRKTLTSC